MSGHSKWKTIKHKKEKEDAKRGTMFTKLIRELTVAAKEGGGDPTMNSKLRTAMENAKNCGMPKDHVEKAIKRGTGELPGVMYEPVSYEGYAPGGAAILVEVLTDNKNRTTAEVRHIFAKYGGNLGQNGCVAWMFEEKGIVYVDKSETNEEKLVNLCIELEGEDVGTDDETAFYMTTRPDKFEDLKKALDENKIKYKKAEITKLPKTTIKVEKKEAKQALQIMDLLEEHEDVQKVYANFDIPDELLQEEE